MNVGTSKAYFIFLIILSLVLFGCGVQDTTSNITIKENKTEIKVDSYDHNLTRNPFLWKIETDKETSYIFGTIHLPDNRVLTLPSVIYSYLTEADEVYTELAYNDNTKVQIQKALYFEGNETLKLVLPQSTYSRLSKILSKKNKSIDDYQNMKVWAIGTILVYIEKEESGDNEAMDSLLARIATENKKTVGGIETSQEQIAVFDTLSLQDQIEYLTDTIDYIEKSNKENKEIAGDLIQAYIEGDEEGLLGILSNEENFSQKQSQFNKRIFNERNKIMADRIANKINRDKSISSFFAVGAGHLPGKNGVLELLRKKGFKISRVKLTASKESCKEDQILKYNICFTPYHPDKKAQVDSKLLKGISNLMRKNPQEALIEFNAAVEIDPENFVAHTYRISTKNALEDYDGALSDADQLVDSFPNKVEAYLIRANMKLSQGDESAFEDFDYAIKLNSSDPSLYAARAKANHDSGYYRDAIDDLTQAISMDLENPNFYFERAKSYMALESYGEATKDLKKTLQYKPHDHLAYFYLGIISHLSKDLQKAISEYDSSIEVFPNSAAYYFRAKAKSNLRKYKEALNDVNQAIELNPAYFDALVFRGSLKYWELNDLKGALEDFDAAIELNPYYAYTFVIRAEIKKDLSDPTYREDLSMASELAPGILSKENSDIKQYLRVQILNN